MEERRGGDETQCTLIADFRLSSVCAAVCCADWKQVAGDLKMMLPPHFPCQLLGFDISGRVEAVGSAVSALRVGDEVIACLQGLHTGAFAEYAVVAQRPTTKVNAAQALQGALLASATST